MIVTNKSHRIRILTAMMQDIPDLLAALIEESKKDGPLKNFLDMLFRYSYFIDIAYASENKEPPAWFTEAYTARSTT